MFVKLEVMPIGRQTLYHVEQQSNDSSTFHGTVKRTGYQSIDKVLDGS